MSWEGNDDNDDDDDDEFRLKSLAMGVVKTNSTSKQSTTETEENDATVSERNRLEDEALDVKTMLSFISYMFYSIVSLSNSSKRLR